MDFPEDYADNELAELDEMREESYDEESEEEKKDDYGDEGEEGQEGENGNENENDLGELGELEALGSTNIMESSAPGDDYVETNVNDTRRSKMIQQDIVNRLSKQEEEKKQPRPSRA